MQEIITVPRSCNAALQTGDLDFSLSGLEFSISSFRTCHARFDERLRLLYRKGAGVDLLLSLRSNFFDRLLIRAFDNCGLNAYPDLALVAVGGYGRQELFLKSDIDILILCPGTPAGPACRRDLEHFISFLWDIKLDIGSSVRSAAECIRVSHHDITIRINVLETRLITGSRAQYELLLANLARDPFWSKKLFVDAKIAEQTRRHHSYQDHAYTLEPDLKNNMGGIRDLHTALWAANFVLGARTFFDMYRIRLIEKSEFEELLAARNFLYEMRCALHTIVERADNRLTLDRQKQVAELLGYGSEGNLPVEKMMRALFRVIKQVRELNVIVLQLVSGSIKTRYSTYSPIFISSSFIRRRSLLDVIDPDIFKIERSMLLEVFYMFSRHRELSGLHVNCIRALREARRSLNFYLIQDPRCRECFKKILADPQCLRRTLAMLNDYRILSVYMPQWEHIEGQTQFDMFHIFSVDEHTIRALHNIQAFAAAKDERYALFRNICHQLPEPQILYTAAFLHDIAKGRGGNHCLKGARDALYFCQLHGYTQHQIKLISWLVANHLLMSLTTKRYDITDFEVINEFAVKVGDEEHLSLLYCLSVVDIAATNEREWTSWKDSIFRQLFFATRQVIRHGLSVRDDMEAHAQENRQLAMRRITDLPERRVSALWQNFQTQYFCQYTPLNIAWHTRNILTWQHNTPPLVLFTQHQPDVTELLVYSDQEPLYFANIACVMAEKKMNVQSAQIMRTQDNHSLATIKFQSRQGTQLDNDRLAVLRRAIIGSFAGRPRLPRLSASLPTVFNIKPGVFFFDDHSMRYTNIEISALDRPGLLAKIGVTLNSLDCLILSARVTTTGERAEDFFAITDIQGRPLSVSRREQLREELIAAIEQD